MEGHLTTQNPHLEMIRNLKFKGLTSFKQLSQSLSHLLPPRHLKNLQINVGLGFALEIFEFLAS